jgi:hypothetical protein
MFSKGLHQTRFANTRLAAEQYDLPVTISGLLPALQN